MSQDKIDAYLHGELSDEECKKWQDEIESNEKLLAEMQTASDISVVLNAHHKKQVRKFWQNVLKETEAADTDADADEHQLTLIPPNKTSTEPDCKTKKIRFFLRIAAIVLVCMSMYGLSTLFMSTAMDEERLAEIYWAETVDFSVVMAGLDRGGGVEEWEEARYKYKAGAYPEALQLLQNTTTSTEIVHPKKHELLSAMCYVQVAQLDTAISILESMMRSEDRALSQEVQWFLALAYTENKEYEKAQQHLKEIINQDAWQADRAKKLLDKFYK